MRVLAGRALGAAAAVAVVLVAQLPAARAGEQPEPPEAQPAQATTAAAAGAPASAPGDDARRDETQAAAALRAAVELEARMVEMRRELDAAERQRASWDDIRARLDGVDGQLRELARELASSSSLAGQGPPAVRFRDTGFAIRSPDDTFLLQPGLRVQGGWAGQLARAGSSDTAPPDTSAFSLSHAEIILDGHVVAPRLQYRLQVDFAETPILKDGYVQLRVSPADVIRVGQFKVPYAMQRLLYSGELELVDISVATAAFSLERDVGLMLDGRPLAGRLRYQVAVLNGTVPGSAANVARVNDNFDLAYAVRLVAAPFGPLPTSEGDIEGHARPLAALGVAGYYTLVPTDIVARTGNAAAPTDVDGNGRIDNVSVWQAAVELRAVFRGAALQAEWFGRRESPGVTAPVRNFWGAYAQASYFVLPHRIEVAARASRTDLPLYGATLDQRVRRGTSVDEESAAVDAYLRGHHAKLQLAYSHLTAHGAGSAPVVDRLQAAAQLWF